MAYKIEEHTHRYAIWTAARAQRAFENNEKIRDAINKTELRIFAKRSKCSQPEFDELHKRCVVQLDKFFGGKYKYGYFDPEFTGQFRWNFHL